MKKRLLALLLALSLLPLVGCADLEGPEADPFSDLIPYYEPEDDELPGLRGFALPYFRQTTLDPITCPDGPHQVIGALLYDGLFSLDGDFTPRPVLCGDYSYDASSLTCTAVIREDAVFSDGSSVTASDVVNTLQRARASERYGQRLSDVESISGSGHTVTIVLKRPNASFQSRLDIPIVKSGTEGRTVPVGSGRYVWRTDEDTPYLAPNEYRWQDAPAPIDRIGLSVCKDADSVAYAFYAREVQLIACDLTGTSTANVSGGGDYTDAPTAVMQYLGFNAKSKLFSDNALRAAMSLGIDRGGCVSAYLLGHGSAAQFPVSPASPLYPAQLERSYSPDDFAAAMEAAGYNKGAERPATLIVSAENAFRVQAARKIAEDLSRYDVKITVSVLSWSRFREALAEGNYDLYYAECRLTPDWDLRPLLDTDGPLNFSGYSDSKRLPQLLSNAAAASPEERSAAVEALCAYVQQMAPFAPICFKNQSVLLPSGAVDDIFPTASDPFCGLENWVLHWAPEATDK